MRQVLCCLLAALSVPTLCQEPQPSHPADNPRGHEPGSSSNVIKAVQMATPPTIDGVIGEEEWHGVPSFEGLVDEQTGAAAPETGRFWLAQDERFIYFAARLQDTQPSTIAATEYRTNVSLGGNDVIALFIDTFGNYAEGNVFRMNPRGATDIRIAGGRAAKREWLGEIQSKGRITESGWEVEARIPWSIMKLPAQGQREMIFNVYRYHKRLQREYSWRYTSGGRLENFGRWRDVAVPASPPNTLKLLPFVYGGWSEDEGTILDGGLDLKTALTDQLELVGTINPDFRNIENDVLSLDFSYFARLAGETRPFFLEGRDYFHTSGDAPIFASQRIDKFDVGIKTFGKLDLNTRLALLNTTKFGEENASVMTVRRQIGPRSSYLVGYSGLHGSGVANDVAFFSYGTGQGPFEYFIQHSFSEDADLGGGQRNNFGAVYNASGVNGVLEYSSVTARYEPKIGFAPQRNFGGLSGSLDIARPKKSGPLLEDGLSVFAKSYDKLDGGPYFHTIGAFGSLTWRDGTDFDFGAEFPSFEGSDDHYYFLSLEKPRGDAYRRWQVDYQWGKIGGLDFEQYNLFFGYRPVERLQLMGSYQRQILGETMEQIIFSANYDLGADRSVSGRLVSREDSTNWYLAYRRAGGRGIDYFLILGDPNAESFRESLVLKVAMPIEIVLGRR